MLDLITILCVTVMTGNEFAVSAFFNPTVWKLEEPSQARALNLLARSLGKIMPVWYAISLVLLVAETYVRWHTRGIHLLLAAVVIWAVAIFYSISALVPINNQLARLDLASLSPQWLQQHKRWDKLHRARIVMLVAASALLIASIVM